MLPEEILRSDLLEILFEDRNKSYGAYELRTHYPARLRKALLCVLLLLALFSGIGLKLARTRPTGAIMLPPAMDSIQLIPMPPQSTLKEIRQTRITSQHIHPSEIYAPTIVRDEIIPPPKLDSLFGPEVKSGDIGIPDPGPEDRGAVPAREPGTEMKKPAESERVWEIAENMPVFPGGIEALKRFLLRNLRMPPGMQEGASVRVLVKFIVDEEGQIRGMEFLESGGKEFDAEVQRVLRKMPTWKAGMQNGRRVAVFFKLPVIFQAGSED